MTSSDRGELVLRLAGADDVDAIAALHATSVEEGFLPTLGPTFLRSLHRRIVRSDRCVAVVAVRDTSVVGAVAATEDVSALYREFVLRDGARAGVAALPRVVRAAPRVLETLRHPSRHTHLPDAEILLSAVGSTQRGRGVGRALVERAVHELSSRGVVDVRVLTTAANTAALAMYRSTGFRPVEEVQTHRGTDSVVLVRGAESTASGPSASGSSASGSSASGPDDAARHDVERAGPGAAGRDT